MFQGTRINNADIVDPTWPGVARASGATRQSVLTALDVLGYERLTRLRGELPRLARLVLPERQNRIRHGAAVEPLCAGVQGGSLPPDESLFEPELVVRGTIAQAPRRLRRAGPSPAVRAHRDRGARAAAAQWGLWTTSTHSPRNT